MALTYTITKAEMHGSAVHIDVTAIDATIGYTQAFNFTLQNGPFTQEIINEQIENLIKPDYEVAVGVAGLNALIGTPTILNDAYGWGDGVAPVLLLSGIGAPSSNIVENGLWYLDRSTHLLYGPKTSNGWGSGFSLQGPAGVDSNLRNAQTGAIGSVLIDNPPESGSPIVTTKPTTDALTAQLASEIVNRVTGESGTTTFNGNSTITDTYTQSGVTALTTFNGNGTVTEVFSGAISITRTTTFGVSTITEVFS